MVGGVCRATAILDDDAFKATVIGLAHGGRDADIGGDAGQDQVPGLLSITSAHSESPEQMERGYMHGFIADFAGWEALLAYQDHPAHQALGAKLVANAVDGKDGILCFDLPVDVVSGQMR